MASGSILAQAIAEQRRRSSAHTDCDLLLDRIDVDPKEPTMIACCIRYHLARARQARCILVEDRWVLRRIT
jgi:hypothetical protein